MHKVFDVIVITPRRLKKQALKVGVSKAHVKMMIESYKGKFVVTSLGGYNYSAIQSSEVEELNGNLRNVPHQFTRRIRNNAGLKTDHLDISDKRKDLWSVDY